MTEMATRDPSGVGQIPVNFSLFFRCSMSIEYARRDDICRVSPTGGACFMHAKINN